MSKEFLEFIGDIENKNTAKVVASLQELGEHDYSKCTPLDLEQIILSMTPNSPKAITTICYVLSLYAKHLGNNEMFNMIQDIDRGYLWNIAKKSAPKKFISHSRFIEVYNDIGVYEEYNSFYYQTLFRSIYEGIYNDDLSVIKNLRASDINGNAVILRKDSGEICSIDVSDNLASDLTKMQDIDIWERRNRYGTCKIKMRGLSEDSCFKTENRSGTSEYSYRYAYYRVLRKIVKEYLEYNLLPLQLYVSGIMHRIKTNLEMYDILLEDAFSDGNKDRLVGKIIANELEKSNCDTEVRNFREMVKGHIDVFD